MREEAAQYAHKKPEVFEVFPENKVITDVFEALESQWLIVTGWLGVRYQGLNYVAAHCVLDMMGIDRAEWPTIFKGLRIMEAAARPVLNNSKDSG